MKLAAKSLLFGTGFVALLSFAFAAPADAHPGYKGHGHGHLPSHPPRHRPSHRPGYRPGYWGPRYPGPRYRGPRIGIGITVPLLPVGYVNLAVAGNPYHYHGGNFYRPARNGYVVVSAPLGASVLTLPGSAVQVQIGGFSYYQYGDAYYQWQPRANRYVVVPPPAGMTAGMVVASTGPVGGTTQPAYAPGQVVDVLPVGYAAEVINGVQYYRYGGHYFMPTQRDGREVYVVVQI